MKAADLKVFNLDDFETHEDTFPNLLSQTTIVTRECFFIYIVHLALDPATFTDDFEERMFQMPLIGR